MLATRILHLTTFGGLSLRAEDRALGAAASQRRPLAVLAVLAAAGHAGVSRDRLVALLWPDAEPERGRRAVNQTLYALRRATDHDELVLGTADVRLNPAVVKADTVAFSEALDAGRFEEAVALYRGPFLDGVIVPGADEFERWLEDERRRWARRASDVVRGLVARSRTTGAIDDEIAWATRLVELDPVDASAVIALVEAYGRAADPVGARRIVQAHGTRVHDELGLPVSRAVLDRLAAIESQFAPQALPPPPTVAAPWRTVASAPASSSAVHPTSDTGADRRQPMATTSAEPVRSDAGRMRSRWPWIVVAMGVVSSVIGFLAMRDPSERSAVSTPRVRAQLLAVAPFSVDSAVPSLAFLAEGVAELLARQLADGAEQRVLQPAAVLEVAANRRAAREPLAARRQAIEVARALGAGEVLVGRAAGTEARVLLTATVIDVASESDRLGATVAGPLDSLAVLVEALAGRLVAGRVGGVEGGAAFDEASLGVLRAFLRGEAASREDRVRDAIAFFDDALDRDSTFAPAALALAVAADRLNSAEQHDRALALAWAARHRLGWRDRAWLNALVGPRFPDPSSADEQIAAWERAISLAPDRTGAWTALGERYMIDGALLGLRDPEARARAAFRRALAIDTGDTRARRRLLELAVRTGDRTALRPLLAAMPPDDRVADYLRWRVAIALDDRAARSALRNRFPSLTTESLRAIALATLHEGIAPDDGARAIQLLGERAVLGAEQVDALLAEHAMALSRGRPTLALDVTERLEDAQPGSGAHLRLRVLDALYADGDGNAAVAAVRVLAALTDTPVRGEAAAHARRLADACVLAQWRAAPWSPGRSRVGEPVRRALAGLRDESFPGIPVSVGAAPRACADIVEAMLAVSRGAPDAQARLARLGERMLTGPALGDASAWATLALARLHEQLGDVDAALRAVRQRPYLNGWPRYRASALRLEASLAMRRGDRAGAASAWRAYVALREESEAALPTLRGADSARARLRPTRPPR